MLSHAQKTHFQLTVNCILLRIRTTQLNISHLFRCKNFDLQTKSSTKVQVLSYNLNQDWWQYTSMSRFVFCRGFWVFVEGPKWLKWSQNRLILHNFQHLQICYWGKTSEALCLLAMQLGNKTWGKQRYCRT